MAAPYEGQIYNIVLAATDHYIIRDDLKDSYSFTYKDMVKPSFTLNIL